MRWHLLQLSLLLILCTTSGKDARTPSGAARAMSTAKREELRQLTKDTWYHAFNAYMKHAYPADELKPLSCTGLTRDATTDENEIQDVMGGYPLTLIDALDSFVVLGDKKGFEDAVRLVVQDVTFDLDARVQVFEVTIRVLGGLLSAHIYASTPKHGFGLSWYTDELLHMAHDLGRRLLPAFQHSLTGLPWARVNLRTGLGRAENMETNSAAAGSLLLEFATLSRLTGDPVFEQVARKALFSLWNRRSALSLLGNTINVQTGAWLSTTSSTGAGIDSFFEYLAKAYILLGDDEYYRIWTEAYAAVMKWNRSNDGFWYRSVHMDTGNLVNVNVDSLSAFFPGLQVLVGDVESAIKSHAVFAMLWERFSGSPEVFNTQARRAESLPWPLRPELVESTLFLYRATKDSSYLHFGERVVHDIVNRTQVNCGLAALENVMTGQQQDRMHSFAVAETLPYLYLLFDEQNPLNHDDSNGVFTTEGHYLALDKSYQKPPPESRKGEAQTCYRYDPAAHTSSNASKSLHTLQTGIPYRTDMEYARSLTGLVLNDTQAIYNGLWDASGYCESPIVQDYSITLLFANGAEVEDTSPSLEKVQPLVEKNAFLIRSIQGLRLLATRRTDETGNPAYYITRIGPYRVSSSTTVYLSDPGVILVLKPQALAIGQSDMDESSAKRVLLTFVAPGEGHFNVTAAKAAFGPDISTLDNTRAYQIQDLSSTNENPEGCLPYSVSIADSTVVVLRRGSCPFLQKMKNAALGGADAVLVFSDEDEALVPSAETSEIDSIERPVPLVLLPRKASEGLKEALGRSNSAALRMQTSRVPQPSKEELAVDLERTPVVVNGHWLVNCKLRLP